MPTIVRLSIIDLSNNLFKVDIDIESSQIYTTDNPNSRVSKLIKSLLKICDMYTPIKKKLLTKVQLPFMNSKHRKSIKKKSMA